MRKLILIKLIFTSLILMSFMPSDTQLSEYKAELKVSQTVYICGGKYSEKFHSHSNCSGLNNCKGGIYSYSSQSAAQSAGYTHCKLCWK